MPTLICDCNQTMPLQPQALGAALNETLTLHSALCRREAGAFQKAVQSGDDVVVACTQEKRLFAEVGAQTPGATSVVKFVNIRETGGWSKDASAAMPKIAALLAAAQLPDAEPVATVTYKSAGRLLIVGKLDQAEQVAALLADTLDVMIFAQGVSASAQGSLPAQERKYPVISGERLALKGWLGAFEASWDKTNPIDLDLCTLQRLRGRLPRRRDRPELPGGCRQVHIRTVTAWPSARWPARLISTASRKHSPKRLTWCSTWAPSR